MGNPIERYLTRLAELRSSGATVVEVSYHSVMIEFIDTIGSSLKPKVVCVPELADFGFGRPDLGLYTKNQLRSGSSGSTVVAVKPERGVVEIKPPNESVSAIRSSSQIDRYLTEYGLVLLTNFREFAIVASGEEGILERYELASTEAAFWQVCSSPREAVERHGMAFMAFMKRALQHAAPLSEPKDVAGLLAAYAQEAMARISQTRLPALVSVRRALEEALGLQFSGDRGDAFFRSTLIQTLFYGVFSAWVLWWKNTGRVEGQKFNWREAAWCLNVPVIQALFEQIAAPSRLGPLKLAEVLDWTARALNRINQSAFFSRFEEGKAVQYFYEPFLEAFDPVLRKQLGVWYTPQEIVQYMVGRVDNALRTELGLEDGLANPNVYILDPCTGTGSFLVETLRTIYRTLSLKGEDALTVEEAKRAALTRVFGFEILPAPLVVAHLQLGLALQALGSTLSPGERFPVYLTNALTGWEPLEPTKRQLVFEPPSIVELEAEQKAAEAVKHDFPILVVIGNPPYNAYAGVAQQEEQGLIQAYKQDLAKQWGIKKYNLDDLYVRFFGIAQRRISKTGRGVVCYISNFSYLGDRSFVAMRQQLLQEFDHLWFDSLNGDSRETGKRTPQGGPDPSVFSTEHNREGIRVGTAVALMVKTASVTHSPQVRVREFWGSEKRAALLDSLVSPNLNGQYQQVLPSKSNKYSFRELRQGAYQSWPRLVDICRESPSNGLMEKRRGDLIDIDRDKLEHRMRQYFDPKVSWSSLSKVVPGLVQDAARFNAQETRAKVIARQEFTTDSLRPYYVRPFDRQWCYYSSVRPLWNECRPTLWSQCWAGNGFVVSRVATDKKNEGYPLLFVRGLVDDHALSPDAFAFPLHLRPVGGKESASPRQMELFARGNDAPPSANLSDAAHGYLYRMGVLDPDVNPQSAAILWMHTLAITYSPMYLEENSLNLPSDWIRIPFPNSPHVLASSAHLGQILAGLLDLEHPVPEVTTASVRPELSQIGVVSKSTGGNLSSDDLRVSFDWGRPDRKGVVMPGRGRVVSREYSDLEMQGLKEGAAQLGIDLSEVLDMLGSTTCDVYLNDVAFWRCIPSKVWAMTVGGYQVLKKWLSYRADSVLDRPLHIHEIREFRDNARRMAAILLLSKVLDSNYLLTKADVYAWQEGTDVMPETSPHVSQANVAPSQLQKIRRGKGMDKRRCK